MEKPQHADTYISPTVEFDEEWREALSDDDMLARFTALIELTHGNVDPSEHPWVADRNDIAARWQHLAVLMGREAQSVGHPLFNPNGWTDTKRADQVLEQIGYCRPDASFIARAIVLVHTAAMSQLATEDPGLSLSLNTINSLDDTRDPDIVAAFTRTFDLRDMSEPTDTVIGEMTLDDFQRLSEEQVSELAQRLQVALGAPAYGNGYGWSGTPQQKRHRQELQTLTDYANLVDYGTSEASEIDRINYARKANEIALLRSERPDFGVLPADWIALPKDVRQRVNELIIYFDGMRNPHDDTVIDEYSLYSTLGFVEEHVKDMVERDILVESDATPSPAGLLRVYALTKPYYEAWVARHFPAIEVEA